jgi:hypothetical protein
MSIRIIAKLGVKSLYAEKLVHFESQSKVVLPYESKYQYIDEYVNYINIKIPDYYDAIGKFRSQQLWQKINGKWVLK